MQTKRIGRRHAGPSRNRPLFDIESLEPRRLLSTFTVNASGGADYSDLETAINSVAAGSTLMVAPGTYTAHTTTEDPTASVFWINKALTIESTGGPSTTTLVAPAGQSQCLLISSSNVTVQGFSLDGGEFCVDVQDFINNTNLTNVILDNLNLTPDATSGDGHGILYSSVSNSVIEGCTVGLSYANGIFLDTQSNNDIVMNNTVNGTVTQHDIAVEASTGDQILNNTTTESAADGIILYTATDCRVVGNNVSGQIADGITLTNDSDSNYVAQNTVVSNGYAMGRTAGTGIWMNNESDGNTVFANTVSGVPENGISAFVSSNNLIQGNEVFDNGQGGIFIFDAATYPESVGNPPANTTIIDNYVHNNVANGEIQLRGASNTVIEGNFMLGNYTGAMGSSTDAGFIADRATNTLFAGNTVENVLIGLYAYATDTGLQVYRNRFLNFGMNFAFTGAGVQFDGGAGIGGNYWNDHAVVGDPSVGMPFTQFIYDEPGDIGGGFADNYPFQDESLGLPYTLSVTSPAAGATVADGSKRVIQWTSTGSALVSLYYSSSETGDVLIAANRPDTGVYAWTVPNLSAASDYVIKIVPENSAGTAVGTPATSGLFSASGSGNLILVSPGLNQTFAPSSTVRVAWDEAVPGTAVNVDIQLNGGAWTPLATGITGGFTDVTLPSTPSSQARIQITDTSGAVDTEEQFFTIGTAVVSSKTSLQSNSLMLTTAQALMLTATVAAVIPGGAAPTGSVTFTGGGMTLGTAPVQSNGTATLSIPPLALGTLAVSAAYSGDTTYAPSSSLTLAEIVSTPAAVLTVVPSIIKSTLPAQIVAGLAAHGSVTVNVDNQTAAAVKGKYKLELFASTDGVIDGTSDALTTVNLPLDLKATLSHAFAVSLHLPPPNLPAGSYTILARLISPSATNSDSTTGPALTVAPQHIALSETVTKMTIPSTATAGAKAHAVVGLSISNAGNITTPSNTTVNLFLAPSGMLDGTQTLIVSLTHPLRIRAGKSLNLVIPVKLIPSVAAGTYTVIAQVIDPNQQASSVSSSVVTIVAA